MNKIIINEEEFINNYNMELRGYNEKLNKVYVELEENGIIILSSLRVELESERLELEYSIKEMRENIIDYLVLVIKEMKENE